MEEANTVSRAVPGEMRSPTPTTSPRSSRSSSKSSGHKRQRLDSKKSMDSSADFISLDFSDSGGEEPIEEEYISTKCISKSTPLGSAGSNTNTPVATNGLGIEEKKGDDYEGGVEEKTERKSKRKRKINGKGVKEATEAITKQEVDDAKEQPGSLSLKAGGESSDEEDGGIKITSISSSNSKDSESEEEEEDKDSSTRRALKAKKQRDTRVPGEGEIETLDIVETAVATAANPEATSVNLGNSVVVTTGKEPKKDTEGMTAKDRRFAKKREKKQQKRDARRAEKKAEKRAGIDLPKGGGFTNLPDGKDDNNEVVDISSDDDDDGGLEINVDLDMGEKAKNNDESGEEGEVAEPITEDADGTSGGETDSSDDDDGDNDNDGGDDDDDSPLVGQSIAIQQRKYYTAFAPPPFRLEEARPLFASIGKVDFTADLVQEREAMAAAAEAFRESKRICNVCTRRGHSEDKCEELKCKHCGSWNKHFPHACPDAERGEDEPRVKDKWRRIPPHLHKSITLSSTSSIPIFCYNCAGNDHFGDDCPRCPPPKVPGSFSLTDINTNTYATQEWLLKFSDKLEILESDGGKSKATFGSPGTKMTVKPPPDPFRDFRNIDDLPQKRLPPPTGPARNGGRDSDSYKSRAGPRDGNGGLYRQRSPVRNPVFDRYRDPRDTLPPRPRSRSPPPRYRSGGGRGGGGGGRGGGGGHMYRPPADYYNRPPREGGGGGGGGGVGVRGGYNGGGGRAYESRSQPPLPNEPAPRRGEAFRPMPSSAKSNWQRHKA